MKAFILFALIAVASASSIKMEEKKDSSSEKKDAFEYKYSIEGGEKKEIKTLLPTYYAAAAAPATYYAAAAPAAAYYAPAVAHTAAYVAPAPASYNYELKYEQAPIVKYKSSMEAIPAPAAPIYKKIEIAAPAIKEVEYKLAAPAPALKEYKYEWAPAPAAPMYYAAPAASASWGYQYAHNNYASYAAMPMAATYYSASSPYYYGYGYPWAK